jgi:hypothetical protein
MKRADRECGGGSNESARIYVSEFVEQSKKSGTVSRAIETAKLRGVSVAP